LVYNVNHFTICSELDDFLYETKDLLLQNPCFTFYLCSRVFATTVNGKVTDGKGAPVTGANVTLKNTYDGASTDANGAFSFSSSETDSQTLVISYVGFETQQQRIYCHGTSVQLNVKLKEVINELNVVVVSAGSFEASDARRVTILSPLDIVTTAGAAGDTYGALQTLPGTQQVGSETGLFVRGGDASETKTFIDGVSIANPYFNNNLIFRSAGASPLSFLKEPSSARVDTPPSTEVP